MCNPMNGNQCNNSTYRCLKYSDGSFVKTMNKKNIMIHSFKYTKYSPSCEMYKFHEWKSTQNNNKKYTNGFLKKKNVREFSCT